MDWVKLLSSWVALSLLAGCCVAGGAQSSAGFEFRFTEKPGPDAVGLKVLPEYDRTRVFQTEGTDKAGGSGGPRPIQIVEWYPAEASAGKKMTLGDYAELVKTETSFEKPVERGKSQDFVAQYMHGTETQARLAVRDAAGRAGRFPVLVYAPSLNAPAIENIELCEYLASWGYVVMASPSMGAAGREMTVDVGGANGEAKDISFLVDVAGRLAETDASEVAVMGYSWGGMGALFAAARDKRVGALVSLDGSFRYSPRTVVEAGDVHPEAMTIPLLVFSRAEETLESWAAMRQDPAAAPSVLNEWTHGEVVHVRMLAMSHIQFSTIYQRSERFRKQGVQFDPADYSPEEGAESYNWVARYTREFLDAALKHDADGMAFLKRTPAENGVPRHLMAVSYRAGTAAASPTEGR